MTHPKTPGPIWVRQALPRPEILRLKKLVKTASRPGQRVAPTSELAMALSSGPLLPKLQTFAPNCQIARIVGFDKTDQQNWTAPWHQDRVIAVARKHDVPGFSNWTRKDGIWHCEPPEHVLRGVLFTRLLLDDVSLENGGMEFAANSDRAGIVSSQDAETVASRFKTGIETGAAGDVLVLPMLTLHRSRKAKQPGNRAVLRIDIATEALPAPLDWLSWGRG